MAVSYTHLISSKMREYVAPTLDDVSEDVVEFIDYVSQPEMASPLMNPDPCLLYTSRCV